MTSWNRLCRPGLRLAPVSNGYRSTLSSILLTAAFTRKIRKRAMPSAQADHNQKFRLMPIKQMRLRSLTAADLSAAHLSTVNTPNLWMNHSGLSACIVPFPLEREGSLIHGNTRSHCGGHRDLTNINTFGSSRFGFF